MVLMFLQQMNHQGVPFSSVKVHSDKAAQIVKNAMKKV